MDRKPPVRRKVRYDPDEIRLYGSFEAAQYLGISRKYLGVLRVRKQMIEPLAELKCGPIWSQSQLDEQLFLWGGEGEARVPA
jgi:hypothetical protein